MSQPPPDQDRPPGSKPSIWPSADDLPAWAPVGQRPPGPPAPDQDRNQDRNQGRDRNQGQGRGRGPDAGQGPAWPPADQTASWPRDEQTAFWPAAGQSSSWPSGGQSPPAGQPPLSSPVYSAGYGRRRPLRLGPLRLGRFPVRAVIVLVLVIAFGIAVRDLTTHHKAAEVAPAAPASVGLQTGLQAPPGPVGTPFALDDGNGNRYQVRLVKVIDPARGAIRASSGKRFVGLVFTVKALAGSLPGENSNKDAVLVGADGQDYPADLNGIAGAANFDDGTIQLAPGQTATGTVGFQLPDGVAVTQVQWTALSGFGSMAEWNAGG